MKMSYDYWAVCSYVASSSAVQQQAIDYLLLNGGAPPSALDHLRGITDPTARVMLLAQALQTDYKEYARTGTRWEPGGLWQLYGTGDLTHISIRKCNIT
jgi:hypothetical protein